jgi:hypothetical protein
MTLRISLLFPVFLLAATACSAGDDAGTDSRNGGVGASPTVDPGGTGGNTTIDTDGGTSVDPNDDRNVPVREKVCDTNGVCTCLKLALLGTLDSAADNKDTTPFMQWLNANSDGTATLTMVTQKPELNEAFLNQYDILLIANVNGWAFSQAEKDAVAKWSKETGGGIVALTGFVSTAGEPAATSQLIEFAGLRYNSVRTAENGQSEPVYYQSGTTNLKECLSWSGSSDAIITTPVKFTGQSGAFEKLTLGLDYVGAFIGYGIDAPAGANVVAKDPISNQNMAVAHEVDGSGRVFVFGDEWVIFANQWEPVGNPHNQQQDEYNKCWQPASGDEAGFFHSVATLYQTKQFWYNAINWVAPPNECGFTIIDDRVIIVK